MQNRNQKFENFIYNILRFRCLLKEKTVNKFFIKNKESMQLLNQAFIHKSFDAVTNYELLEFRGDVIVNACVVEFITDNYPLIVSIKWNTRLKHTLVSGKVLARMAVRNGFEEFLQVSDELRERFNTFPDKWDCEDYQAAYEDTVEALCGAISQILNKHTTKGVGYVACYNLISSFLKEEHISLEYEDVFDAKSRLKEVFDAKKWNDIAGCRLSDCLYSMEVNEKSLDKYMKESSRNKGFANTNSSIVNSNDRFIAFGYACIDGNPKNKTLLSVTTANKKKNAEQKAADEVIKRLTRMGISLPIPNAYEVVAKKQHKPKNV